MRSQEVKRDKWLPSINGKRHMAVPSISKYVPLGVFLREVRKAIDNPDAEFKQGLTCWWSVTGAEIRQQFRGQIRDRINQAIPYIERS